MFGKADNKVKNHNYKRDSMTMEERIVYREKQTKKTYTTGSGIRFRPLKIADCYVRAAKIDGVNFFLVTDLFFNYGRSTTPNTGAVKKANKAINSPDSSITGAIFYKINKNGTWVCNWLGARFFLNGYNPIKNRNINFKVVFDGDDIFAGKVATTETGNEKILLPISQKYIEKDSFTGVLLESINAGKNLASIERLITNGGMKYVIKKGEEKGISVVLNEMFDPATVKKLEKTSFFEWDKTSFEELDMLIKAVKEKLPNPAIKHASMPVGGTINSIAQLVNSLTGKKLVVTFELK